MHGHISRPLRMAALAAALSSVACTDQTPTYTTPGSYTSLNAASRAAATAAVADSQRVPLAQLTRAVALAMGDAGLRQRVKNDMRKSPMREHKLEFGSYLKGESGGILLAKMAKETGASRDEILALLGSVRPLEFYMPVAQHRETWRGDAELVVASQIEDRSALAAYSPSGESVTLSPTRAPVTPVLVLTPIETDFSRPLDLSRVRNTRDQGGLTIGTYMMDETNCDPTTAVIECSTETGGGGGGGTAPAPGLYMTLSHIPDTREGWAKGAPEIEYHIQGPNFEFQNNSADLACSGEEKSGSRYFNQDHPDYSGRVLLFTKAQMDEQRNAVGDSKFHITVWEDDDTTCKIKTDNQDDNLRAIGYQMGYNAAMASAPVCPACAVVIGGYLLGMSIYYEALWYQGNDDYIGLVQLKGSDPRYSSIPTNYVILKSDSDDITGYARIVTY